MGNFIYCLTSNQQQENADPLNVRVFIPKGQRRPAVDISIIM
jgi:hypothetical protein